MRRKRFIALCLSGMLCVATSAQAAPLTDFDTWRGSIDLGAWKTDVNISEDHDGVDLDGEWNFTGGITHKLGGRWGLQYQHHGMSADGNWFGGDKEVYSDVEVATAQIGRYREKVDYTGYSDELNIVYSLKKNVALFAGANRVRHELRYTNLESDFSAEGKRTHFQGGVVAKAPLSDKVDAYGLVGGGTHGLFQAEAGFAFKMRNDWEANVGYRWFRVKDAFDRYSGPNGHGNMPSVGKVKVDGVTFGVTHFFGSTPKKEAPPIVIPPVVQPPVVKPPVVNPPENKIEKELIDKKKIVLKGVNFDFDMDTLQPQGYPILNQVVVVANKYPQWTFLLVGHTDNYGTDEYNIDLSWRRVKTVQRYLVSQGISENRLAIDAKGEGQPIATNDTAEGRAENRRVELSLE